MPLDLGIAGRHALVVGGSKGLGLACCQELAAAGCRVTAVARTPTPVHELPGEGHRSLTLDLLAPGALEELRAQVSQPCSIVVHNQGGTLGVNAPLASGDDYERVWRLNLGIAVELNRHLLEPMREAGWGRVVHVSSATASTFHGAPAYVSAKAALNAYVKSLARTFAPHNVVVSAVAPGALNVPGRYMAKIQTENGPEWQEYAKHHLSRGRLGEPAELAPFVALLCSDLAAFAAGTICNLDGASA